MPLRRPQPAKAQPPLPEPAVTAGCSVLLRDTRDNIALVRADSPNRGWTLPRASPRSDEDPRQALSRMVCERTGMKLRVSTLLVVEWVRPDPVHGAPGGLHCIWDIDPLATDQWADRPSTRRGPDDRRLVQIVDLSALGQPLLERRIRAAVSARAAGRTEYLPPAY
jgi:ADP-ribose pyrophosphatase YjhB (NUDIX family)